MNLIGRPREKDGVVVVVDGGLFVELVLPSTEAVQRLVRVMVDLRRAAIGLHTYITYITYIT